MKQQRASKRGVIGRLWHRLVVESIEKAENESQASQSQRKSLIDGKAMVICIVVAVNLAILSYYGMSNQMGLVLGKLARLAEIAGWRRAPENLDLWLAEGTNARLMSLFFWAASCVLMYFVVPALVVKLAFKESLASYGLSFSGGLSHLKIYLVLFLIVLPAVIAVSFTDAFQDQYPFYQDYGNRIPVGFVYWELAYAAQFFALEFFFRGFMVHGLKHRLGFYAVLVMVIPYCMIHFGKPFPETLGAVVAGLVLGLLSLRTGTIWPGFLIHVSVAWSMDLAALWQKGLL